MAVVMRGPKSYTREDVAEIQSHGGTQVLRRILEAVTARGARLAEAGEFTRRAFLNGRIDLSRAEAVMSLIRAGGEQERRAAVRQMNGGTADFIRKASDELYTLQAGLAACIDYPEEISDEEGAGTLREGLSRLTETLKRSVDERSARLIYDGMQVTLFGIPNAGKSSLLNALIGQEKAIVTAIPGTTRDTVEGEMILDGIRVHLTDTAGMRDTEDPIERIGVERSERARQNADITLLILDSGRDIREEEREWIRQLKDSDAVILNKSDLSPVMSRARTAVTTGPKETSIATLLALV
jgi:tRNA modification GTPase